MTVSSTSNRNGPYVGNGATVEFAWTFKCLDAATMKVYQTVGSVTTEVTTGITKNGIPGTSGTVVFDVAPASGVLITIIRESDFLQSSDYASEGRVTPEQVEDDLDRAMMAVQDLKEEQARALKVDVAALIDPVLPVPAPGQVIGWNGAGNALINIGAISTDDTPVTAAVDNAVLRWNSDLGGIQDSVVTISDTGALAGVLSLNGTEPSAAGLALLGAADDAAQRVLLGTVIGTHVQAYNVNLASLAGIAIDAGDLLYGDGASSLTVLPKGTALQYLRMNAGATAPEWAASDAIGVGQTWTQYTTAAGPTQRLNLTVYQNTTGRPIMVTISGGTGESQVSTDAGFSSYVIVGRVVAGDSQQHDSFIVPDNWYYRVTGGYAYWAELR